MPKTPSFILKKIEECRAKQAKSLDLRCGDDFGEIRLIAIPPEVFTLTQLKSLDLRNNAIQVVPEEIKQLTQLKRLDLRGNPLRQVADVAGLFVHYADFVKLNLPPKNIVGLKLTLSSHDAPEHIFELPNLTALEISNHRLSQIPDWVLKLEKLTELDFSNNELNDVSELEKLSNLCSLNLSSNSTLTHIPNKLISSTKLESLKLGETPINHLSIKQLEQEGFQIEEHSFHDQHYSRKRDAESCYLHEAKLLIIGDAGVGKTFLVHKIMNPDYTSSEFSEMSDGVSVIKWQFPYNHEHTYHVNIWDFGGQDIYYETHQFFLTQHALYILVTDNRKEDSNLYFWLNTVRVLSNNSPLLILQNKRDGHVGTDINESALKGEFSNLKEIYSYDLKNNTNEFNLFVKEHLPYHLKQLPSSNLLMPRIWQAVRSALETDVRNYIELSEFLTLCEKEGFKHKKNKLELSNALHDLGIILHFQEDPLLENTIFLNPNWITMAVHHFLGNETIRANRGKFTYQQLKDIWYQPEYDFMHNELLQLMLKFKFCYPLNYCKNTYITPQLLSENSPTYVLPTQDSVTVYYKNYEFMPKGMVRQLIVVLHEHIAEKQHLVWKSGVVLEKKQTYAEIIENYGKREIRIRVVGQNRHDLMSIVMYELNKIHNSYHNNLKYEVLLPCSCEEPYYFNFEILKEFAAENSYIQCQKRGCWKLLNANLLIGGVMNLAEQLEDITARLDSVERNNLNSEITQIKELEKTIDRSNWYRGLFSIILVIMIIILLYFSFK